MNWKACFDHVVFKLALYPNVGLTGALSWQRIAQNFQPALGYVQEAGIQTEGGEIGWRHRTKTGVEFVHMVEFSQRKRLDGTERSSSHEIGFDLANARGDYIGPRVHSFRETIASSFEMLPGVQVAAGEHRFHAVELTAESSPSRVVAANLKLRAGGYFNGKLYEQSSWIKWRPSPHWALRGNYARQDARFASGRFIARTVSLAIDHAASTRSEQSLILQRDNVTDQTAVGLRWRWIIMPGRELRAAFDRTWPALAADETQTRATITLVWNWER